MTSDETAKRMVTADPAPLLAEQASIQATLAERGARYGDFVTHAAVTQNLKRALQAAPSWTKMSDSQKEALEMVCHKLGRIANGDPDYRDSWWDCIGFLQLIVNEMDGL